MVLGKQHVIVILVILYSHLFAQDNKTENIPHNANTGHNHSHNPGDPEAHVLDRIK